MDVLRFLRGGIWRGFLSKYPEVNLLHKKMLRVSRKLANARPSGSGAAQANGRGKDSFVASAMQ